MRDYKKIVAWQRAHELTLAIYQKTKHFPSDERYGLTSQLRRSAHGVAANVVEGSGRGTKRDYLRFLYIAFASLKETEYSLLLARDLGYLADSEHEELSKLADGTFAPLHGLLKAVKKEAGGFGSVGALLMSAIVVGLSRLNGFS